VTWVMWQGDPFINAFVQGWVAPRLFARNAVTLRAVNGQGNMIVSALMTEKEAGKAESETDMMWNQRRNLLLSFARSTRSTALHQPLAERGLIDFENPFIKFDFQQEVKGSSARGETSSSPSSTTRSGSRAHRAPGPRSSSGFGRTRGASPSTTRSRHDPPEVVAHRHRRRSVALAGPSIPPGMRSTRRALGVPRRAEAVSWKKGETYPAAVSEVHRLFTSGEVDFTMSNNDGEVDNKILQGLLPDTRGPMCSTPAPSRTPTIWESPRNAPHLAGRARRHQLPHLSRRPSSKRPSLRCGATGPYLRRDVCPSPAARFRDVPDRRYSPRRADIQKQALMSWPRLHDPYLRGFPNACPRESNVERAGLPLFLLLAILPVVLSLAYAALYSVGLAGLLSTGSRSSTGAG
jgi:putative spermidine/putrescine transport system substrate-binding protein